MVALTVSESEPDSTSYPPCCEALPPLKTNFERLNTNMNTDENDSRTFKNPLSESQNSGIFNSVDLKDFDFYAPSMSSSGLRADKENFPRTNSTEKSSKRKLSHLQNEKRSNFKDSSTICQKNSSKNRLENGKHHTDQDRNLSQMKSYPDITSAEFNSQSVHRQLDPGKKPFLDSESFQSTFQSYKSNDQTALSSFNNNRVGHCGSTLMNPCDSERVFDSDEQNQDSEGKVIAHSSQQSFSGFYSCEGLEDMSETEESQSKFLNRKDEVLSESLKLTQYIIENRRRQDYRPKNRKRTFTEASLEDGIQGNSGHSDSWLVTESLEIDTDIALSQESCDKESVFKSSKCPSFDLESQDLDSEDYSQSQFSDSDFAE